MLLTTLFSDFQVLQKQLDLELELFGDVKENKGTGGSGSGAGGAQGGSGSGSGGAAGSWQMSNRGATMVADEFDFGFAVDWMRKDLGMVLEEGERLGAALPITRQVNDFYGEVQDMGGGRWDTSSLIRRLK